MAIKAEYSLTNIEDALSAIIDDNESMSKETILKGLEFIYNRLKHFEEFSSTDKEYFFSILNENNVR